jgi:hypothetical protein
MSGFFSKLAMEAVGDDDSGQWVLTEALLYYSSVADRLIVVPKGFQTDLASTPRLPVIYLLAGNVATKAAVVHDWLYSSGEVSRKVADAVLREASEASGVSWFQRWMMWAGVRIGGSSHYTSQEKQAI